MVLGSDPPRKEAARIIIVTTMAMPIPIRSRELLAALIVDPIMVRL